MGIFKLSTYPTIEDRVNKWTEFGVLDSIESEDSKKLVAMALDAAVLYMGRVNYMDYPKDAKSCVIPVIVSVFKKTDKEFDLDTLTKSVVDLIDGFLNRWIEENETEPFRTGDAPDREAELVKSYSKQYQL